MTLNTYLSLNKIGKRPGISYHKWPKHLKPIHEGRVMLVQSGKPWNLLEKDRAYYMPPKVVKYCTQEWWWDLQPLIAREYKEKYYQHTIHQGWVPWCWIENNQNTEVIQTNPLDELWTKLELGPKYRGWSIIAPQVAWPTEVTPERADIFF